MTKTDRILDLIDHPHNYSDSELDALLSDPEMRLLYNLLCNTRSALCPPSEPDIDKEWQQIIARCAHRRALGNKVAAAVVAAVIAISAVAVGTGKYLSAPQSGNTGIEETITGTADTSATANPSTVTDNNTTVIFQEQTLGEIVDSIGSYYGAKVVFNNPDTRRLRLFFKWNRNNSLGETIGSLNNFEKISIAVSDNTITVN